MTAPLALINYNAGELDTRLQLPTCCVARLVLNILDVSLKRGKRLPTALCIEYLSSVQMGEWYNRLIAYDQVLICHNSSCCCRNK